VPEQLTSPPFVAYIRAITKGPLLSKTVHDSVLEGKPVDAGQRGLADKWKALCKAVGEAEARRQVGDWIDKPWSLIGKPAT
jgi:hypothetical protein